jgi:hypothetical protein
MSQFTPGKVVYARFEFIGIEDNDRAAPKFAQWDGPRAVCVCVDRNGEWMDNARVYLRLESLIAAPQVKAEMSRGTE